MLVGENEEEREGDTWEDEMLGVYGGDEGNSKVVKPDL
jgi:hypothetical protein